MKKIPLGIKILSVLFLLLAIYYMLSFLTLIPIVETVDEWTPEKIGWVTGAFIRHVFLIAINLFAGIGLLRLKRWGLICSSISLILEGIAFAINFGIGFAEGYGNGSVALKTAATVVGFLIVGVIIALLIIYMKKRLKKGQPEFQPPQDKGAV